MAAAPISAIRLNRWVVAGGGGTTSGGYKLEGGFWETATDGVELYLPILAR